MTQFLVEYGLFLAKAITVVVAIGAVLLLVFAASMRKRGRAEGQLTVTPLNDRYRDTEASMKRGVLPQKAFKKVAKAQKSQQKKDKKKDDSDRRRVFVLNFKGDIRASAVASLREEITAVLSIVRAEDEVVVRLENPGGLVHEHGLAASQLQRLKQRGVRLTVVIDKVAASGGYMMACVADSIVAAPFAVVGSIGVLAQIPNFHRLLDRHGVDFEMIKAGELKRTLTIFGENTDEDRERLQEQIEDTHVLFKDFVVEQRPALDMEVIATGEHWHGLRALEHKLVDELQTSDDYLLNARDDADLYEVVYQHKKDIGERIASVMQSVIDKAFVAFATRLQKERVSS